MIRVCSRCDTVYGEKEPLDNPAKSHGLCKACFQAEMFRIAAESVAQVIQAEPCILLRVLLLKKFLAVADSAWERDGLFTKEHAKQEGE
jgi:hypothetical protein